MLERQNVTIPFAQGVETKTDPKQVPPGKLLELENGVFRSPGQLEKRSGHVKLSQSVAGGGSISSSAALGRYGDELLLADGSDLYSYDNAIDEWNDKGPFNSIYTSKTAVVRDTATQKAQDSALHPSGLQVFVYEQTSVNPSTGPYYAGVFYSIVDTTTGQIVVPSTNIGTTTYYKPKALTVNDTFVLYVYATDGRIKAATISIVNPTATPVFANLTANVANDYSISNTSPNYDVCTMNNASGQAIYLAFNNRQAGTSINGYSFGNPLSSTPLYHAEIVNRISRSITVFPAYINTLGTMGPLVAFSTDNGLSPYAPQIYLAQFDLPLNSIYTDVSAFGGGTFFDPRDIGHITGSPSGTAGTVGIEIYFDSILTGGSWRTAKYYGDFTSGFTLNHNWLPGTFLGGKAFQRDGTVYVPVLWNSDLQSTYFFVTSSNRPVAKALPTVAGEHSTQYDTAPFVVNDWVMPTLPSVSHPSANVFAMALLEQATSNGSGGSAQVGVSGLKIDFDNPTNSFQFAELGNDLHWSGGILQMYDGVDVVEHGFNLYPEYVSATAVADVTSQIEPGNYQYKVTYEWIDNKGNLHRSAPSTAASVTVATNQRVDISVPYLQLTDKQDNRSPVQIIVYRTLVISGTPTTEFHRVSDLSAPTPNVIGGSPSLVSPVPMAVIPDKLSSVNAAERALLYTTGGILPNFPAPPAKSVTLHRNRLWVVDSENPLTVYYSKDRAMSAPVEFAGDAFSKTVDPRGGPITALASLDDKFIVFKRTHMFFFVGQGPIDTGAQNDLSDSILITTDVGCIDPRSIVGTPVGLMFKSAKGIYLIDRSLQVQYVGSPVEAYNSQTITSATLAPNVNQVRFTLGNGLTLVYDYFMQQWSVFTNSYAIDSVLWNDSIVLLRAGGVVWREAPGVYTDVGAAIKLKATTAWLSFANVQGFQRVRRAQVLGTWKSSHNLQVTVYNDFLEAPTQQVTAYPVTPGVYGGGSPYGSGSPYGGTQQGYQWRIDLARQKCQSVKFTVEDLPVGSPSEGMALSAISFEVGAKKGLNKLPADQIATGS